jgi:hypothetical protein
MAHSGQSIEVESEQRTQQLVEVNELLKKMVQPLVNQYLKERE